jgi:hypothetical protein
MATTYTSKVSVRCVKQHTCVACASKYSYVLVRNLQGTGGTAAAAEANAEKAALKAVQGEVDFHPCPACGVVQPDMTAVVVNKRFWIAGLVGLAGVVISFICGFSRATQIMPAAYIGAAFTLVGTLIAAWANFYAPNRDLVSNRATSEGKCQAGKLKLDERAAAQPDAMLQTPASQKRGHRIGLALCAAAVVATLAPPALQTLGGWPTNKTSYPEVVGAGDEARFYFNEDIVSINGKWKGHEIAAYVTNADKLGTAQPRLTATTKSESWGTTISGKSVSNSTNKMYLDVKFPAEPDLAGKELALNMQVRTVYPHGVGNDAFQDESKVFKHATTVTMGPAGSGTKLYRAWWEGELMAASFLIVSLLVALKACASLRGDAVPTTVFQADDSAR